MEQSMSRFNVNTMRGNDEYETLASFDDEAEAVRFADASGEPAWVERTDAPDENGSYYAHRTKAYLNFFGTAVVLGSVILKTHEEAGRKDRRVRATLLVVGCVLFFGGIAGMAYCLANGIR